MKKRPRVAVLNTIAASGANVLDDATGNVWGIVDGSGAILLGTFPRGKIVRKESFTPVAENRQVVLLGASATKEVIAAATRYKIEIGNPEVKYETFPTNPAVHAYTTPVALSGDADTDRLNVFSALVNKVNNYAGNNASASLLHQFAFTLGGASGNDELTVGTTITQQTSGVTAVVGKVTVTSGSWAGGDAAGTIWVYGASGDPTDGALTWGYASSTITQTIHTLLLGTGMACVDDAGYFISSLTRKGANWYAATQGFQTAVFELAEAAVYAMGIGSVLAQLEPRYDPSKQDAIEGELDYELVNGDHFDTSKTYIKYVITIQDGDEKALEDEKVASLQEISLYADYGDAHRGDLDTAIGNLT